MDPNQPQTKPLGDQDALDTFSLSERRRVDPVAPTIPTSFAEQVERVVADITPRADDSARFDLRPPIVESEGADSTMASIEAAKAEIQTLLMEVRALKDEMLDAAGVLPNAQPIDATSQEAPKEEADPARRIKMPTFDEREAEAGITGTMAGREPPKPAEDGEEEPDQAQANEPRVKIPTFEEREAEAGLTGTQAGREDQPEETEEDDDENAKPKPGDEIKTSDDALPVALDKRAYVLIPGITGFDIWEKISDNPNWDGLTLQVTVSGLAVDSWTFIDEFEPDELSEMVTFNGSDDQIEFKMPLAQRKSGHGNSWFTSTVGGVYILPTFCVDGNAAIFPVRVS